MRIVGLKYGSAARLVKPCQLSRDAVTRVSQVPGLELKATTALMRGVFFTTLPNSRYQLPRSVPYEPNSDSMIGLALAIPLASSQLRNGNTVSFDTKETSIEKYIEILPEGGDYSWSVAAIGADGSEICKSPTVSFSKPDSKWIPPEKPVEEEEEGEPMCDPMDCEGSCPDQYYCGG